MNDYQEKIREFDLFKEGGSFKEVAFLEKVLGLVGEAGETADKVKKVLRDKNGELGEVDREEIVKELGDVLWYVASIARYLGVELEEVARKNVEKLESRKKRNLINGEGDNR